MALVMAWIRNTFTIGGAIKRGETLFSYLNQLYGHSRKMYEAHGEKQEKLNEQNSEISGNI